MALSMGRWGADFSRYLENLSLNLSPCRRETLNFPPSLEGKGARGLGQSLAFPHNMKSQVGRWGNGETRETRGIINN
ncbi:hypothetical protein A6S26_01100 [Nostoc sp. ATCC 43529]|nr:hypothetical protein A6S26_01100 [Nostoc sp. ATCC 43529]